MITVAALDPASFGLWFNTNWFRDPDPAENDLLFQVIQSCLAGNHSDLFYLLQTVKDEEVRVRYIHYASLIWHEQRHFVDLLLTNYGAFRFCQYFQLYVNMGPILYELQKNTGHPEIYFPFYLYAYKDQRDFKDIPPIPKDVIDFADIMEWRKRSLDYETETLPNHIADEMKKLKPELDRETQSLPRLISSIGGEGQLEALGYLFQIGPVQHFFDRQIALKVSRFQDPNDDKYTWFRHFARAFGTELREQNGVPEADFKHVVPIVYAALATRGWGQEVPNNPNPQASNDPTGRILCILDYFHKQPNLLKEKNQLDDIWETLNNITLDLFGRTIIEEIRADLKQSQAYITTLSTEDVPAALRNVYAQYHRLRTTLVDILESNPEALLDIPHYARTILPLVRPIPIWMFPGGRPVEELQQVGLRPLMGHDISPEVGNQVPAEFLSSLWCWRAIPENWSSQGLCFPNLDDWAEVMQSLAPMAKLFFDGRDHRTAFGPELLHAEDIIKSYGLNVRFFDHTYQVPSELSMPAQEYYAITHKETAICDFCKQKIHKPNGRILSPWIFHAEDSGNEYLAKEVYGGGVLGQMLADRDWAPQLGCDSCIDKLKARNILK